MPISRLINACKRHRRYFIAVATRKTVFSYPETKTYFAGKSNAGIRFSDLCRGGPLVGVCWLARARSAADNRKKTLLAPVSRVFHVLRPARFPRSKARPILLSSTRVGFFFFPVFRVVLFRFRSCSVRCHNVFTYTLVEGTFSFYILDFCVLLRVRAGRSRRYY